MCRTPLRIVSSLRTFRRGANLAIDPVQNHWMIGSPTESVGDMAAIGVIVVGRRGKARCGESGKAVHPGRRVATMCLRKRITTNPPRQDAPQNYPQPDPQARVVRLREGLVRGGGSTCPRPGPASSSTVDAHVPCQIAPGEGSRVDGCVEGQRTANRAMRVPPAMPPTQISSPTSMATVPRINRSLDGYRMISWAVSRSGSTRVTMERTPSHRS